MELEHLVAEDGGLAIVFAFGHESKHAALNKGMVQIRATVSGTGIGRPWASCLMLGKSVRAFQHG